MLRKPFVGRYNDDMTEAFRELFETCRKKMFHPGDLLLCQQNGTMLDGSIVLGFGEEGLNSLQQINALFYNGIGKMTEDRAFFIKYGNDFLHGTSELETTLQAEMKTYQEIWENAYFLRILTQVVRVANGEKYDWELDIYKVGHHKSNHVRDRIIKKLDACPKFKNALEIGYRGRLGMLSHILSIMLYRAEFGLTTINRRMKTRCRQLDLKNGRRCTAIPISFSAVYSNT